MQQEKQKLRVLIQPAPGGFTAVCLELSLAAEEKDKIKVADGIAKLINANMSSVNDKTPTEALRFDAPKEFFEMYDQGKVYDFSPELSQKVTERYVGIEYRIG